MGLFDEINKHIRPPAAKLTLDMLLKAADHVYKYVPQPDPTTTPAFDPDAWEACKRLVADAPTAIAGIRTHHAVPFGRHFKQYDTNGRLWLWVNRGEVEDLPHVQYHGFEVIAGAGILGPELMGVPVYNE